MAKPIVLAFEGAESTFDHAKLDRARLYGARKRIPLDQEAQPCVKAALTTDGLYLLQSGMTAQGYFDEEGRWLQRGQLVGLGPDGNALELKPSTLGVAKEAVVADPSELLRHTIDAVYVLDPSAVDGTLAGWLDAAFDGVQSPLAARAKSEGPQLVWCTGPTTPLDAARRRKVRGAGRLPQSRLKSLRPI
jgi:hypothetical protein